MNECETVGPSEIGQIITSVKKLAILYRERTGRPLGITGEVAEYEAARLLKLRLAAVRQCGFDAIRERDGKKLQIKGRCVIEKSNPGQRLGRITFTHEWDAVLLVILDQKFEPLEIHEAERQALFEALTKPGSKSRNERGALGVGKFKSISRMVWNHTSDKT